MNESGVIDLRPMRGVLITPGLAANEPDRVEVHDKEPGEATDAWIRRAVGCDLFDVVVAGRIDIWVDDEGLLKELEPNMVASLMAADPERGHMPMLVGRAFIVPTQADGETRGFNHEIAAVVAHELASVAESLFSAWAASPQGQVAAMKVFGPDRPTAALRAINRLASLEERAAQFGGWVPGWLQEQLTAAREERSQYADYGDAAAALDRVGRA